MGPKIFLATTSVVKYAVMPYHTPHYILDSFMFLRPKTEVMENYIQWALQADMFLLDSGAFTFLNKSGFDTRELKKYINEYTEFINRWDIEYFFELDIDSIVGYDNVLKIRAYIEDNTGKKCIPVWHIHRGLQEFKQMCEEYDYVAIGGIVKREIPKKHYEVLYRLCDIAHHYGCKIHGLGYLPLSALNENTFPFDTCDGTTWQGHRHGVGFRLNDGKLERFKDGQFWKDNLRHSFGEWTAFSRIVESNNSVQYNNNVAADSIVEDMIRQCIEYGKGKQNEKSNKRKSVSNATVFSGNTGSFAAYI